MDADAVLRSWLRRDGEFSPGYYAYYGPNETSEAIRAHLDRTVGPDASVLELGCSAGRHLAHLHENGYTDLAGIDVNHEAREVMEATYPDLFDAGRFFFDAIESVITEFEDDAFDAVFSVETLQHIHHDNEWVFGEVARITDEVLLTVEQEPSETHGSDGENQAVVYVNEDFPLYRRAWRDVFEDHGFVQSHSMELDRDILRVFRSPGQ